MSDAEDGTTVTATSKGQATIPKEFRDKLHIDTPGRVRFVENEAGEIVVWPVNSISFEQPSRRSFSSIERSENVPSDFYSCPNITVSICTKNKCV